MRRDVRNTGHEPIHLVIVYAPAQYPPGTGVETAPGEIVHHSPGGSAP